MLLSGGGGTGQGKRGMGSSEEQAPEDDLGLFASEMAALLVWLSRSPNPPFPTRARTPRRGAALEFAPFSLGAWGQHWLLMRQKVPLQFC